MTQAVLAEKSGFQSVNHVSRMETGALPISDSALVKLARGLSMGIDALDEALGAKNGKTVARSA